MNEQQTNNDDDDDDGLHYRLQHNLHHLHHLRHHMAKHQMSMEERPSRKHALIEIDERRQAKITVTMST